MDSYNKFCIPECPKNHFKNAKGECEKRCPENRVLVKGFCVYIEWNTLINNEYLAFISSCLFTICLAFIIYQIRKTWKYKLPYVEIQSHFAVALAKIHNLNQDRAKR